MTTQSPIPPSEQMASDPPQKEPPKRLSIEVDPLEGKTSIDDKMTFEVVALAHRAAAVTADQIAEEIRGVTRGSTRPLIVYLNDELAAAIDMRRAFLAQANMLQRSYSEAEAIAKAGIDALEALPPDRPETQQRAELAAATVAAAVGAGVEILGLLRQDTSYYGRSVEVRNHVLGAELGRAIRKVGGMDFLWPGLSPSPRSLATQRGKAASFLDTLHRAAAARHSATRKVLEFGAKVQDLDPQDERLSQARRTLDHAHVVLDSAEGINEDLGQSLYSTDERGRTPAHWLQIACDVADDLAERRQKSQRVYLLRCWVESGGGSYRIKRSLMRTLFVGEGLSYSGGIVACYTLMDTEGEQLSSGSVIERTSYVNFDNPRRGLLWWWRQRRGVHYVRPRVGSNAYSGTGADQGSSACTEEESVVEDEAKGVEFTPQNRRSPDPEREPDTPD